MEEKKRPSKRATSAGKSTTGTSKAAAGSASKAAAATKSRARGEKPTPAATAAKKKPSAKRNSLPPQPSAPDPAAERRAHAKQTALAAAMAALDKKAERVEIVDIGEKVDYADYLVVMTGRSDRQVVAIADGIEEALKKAGNKRVGVEGLPQGHWVLIDCGDVIVHVFLDEARKYYDLEGLWMDAPRVPTPTFGPRPSVPPAAPGHGGS